MVCSREIERGRCFRRQTVKLLFVLIKKGYWQVPVGFLKEITPILIEGRREEELPSPEPFAGFGKKAALTLLPEVFDFWGKRV